MTTTTITISRSYFDEYVAGGYPAPPVVRRTARTVTIEVDPDSKEWTCLQADAESMSRCGDRQLEAQAATIARKMRDAEAAIGWRYTPPVADGTKATAHIVHALNGTR